MMLSISTAPTMRSAGSGIAAALDEKLSLTRSVELIEEDALRVTKEKRAVLDEERQADADEHRFDVTRRILRRVELMLEVDARRHQAVDVVVNIFEPLGVP